MNGPSKFPIQDLELKKLELEIAKLEAEKKKIEDDGLRAVEAQRKLEAEVAKLAAEKKKVEDDSARAAEIHQLQLEKLKAGDGPVAKEQKGKDNWAFGKNLLQSPAFLGCVATVVAAFFAFLPQIQNFRAIYDKAVIEEQTKVLKNSKELLESQRKFQTEINESIKSSNTALVAIQDALARTNRDILAEVGRQKIENSLLITNLAVLKNQIQGSMAELEKFQVEKTNLLATVEDLRAESRHKELQLADKDRLNAIDRVATHLHDLDKEYDFLLDWNRQPEDIANLLQTAWRTNITEYLAKEVVAKTNAPARSRFVAAFILYHEDPTEEHWKHFLLDMIRSGRASKFYSRMDFDYAGSTNRVGSWRVADTREVWSAYFEALCIAPLNSEARTRLPEVVALNSYSLQQLVPEELQRLSTNFCDTRALFHALALEELSAIDRESGGFRPGFEFLKLSDPVLLAVMSARKLAALFAPISFESGARVQYGYAPVAEVLGHYGDSSYRAKWEKEFQQLGLPVAVTTNGVRSRTLNPSAWQAWVSNTNNLPVIEAALSPNLSTWDSLAARRAKEIK